MVGSVRLDKHRSNNTDREMEMYSGRTVMLQATLQKVQQQNTSLCIMAVRMYRTCAFSGTPAEVLPLSFPYGGRAPQQSSLSPALANPVSRCQNHTQNKD
ncbi:hypothetical protein EYF80_033719 [Liparis tanakae]|uniref:Uncharacterized protein n=1 Tax=Liparis tanakae TaxID=230148 RepID=A0A4Z2GQY6_9TELE|nr:hypothetical protein EYF80_033719 [Liparis tanakae]